MKQSKIDLAVLSRGGKIYRAFLHELLTLLNEFILSRSWGENDFFMGWFYFLEAMIAHSLTFKNRRSYPNLKSQIDYDYEDLVNGRF